MGNLATTPMVRGAWVGKCPVCGTCCFFSRFPATDYAGQQVVRLDNFNSVTVLRSCGRRFQTDGDDLLFVTITSLSIQRLSPDSFAVKVHAPRVLGQRATGRDFCLPVSENPVAH